jgi:UDP-GlcNAc3NAcA epimerase
MKKIVTILGARPQFIKASVLSRLILKDDQLQEVIIHTGQHFDKNMSDIFFDEMEIPKPKYNLKIQSKLHGEMTGLMMSEIEKIVLNESPDCILVYGDTNSTLAGALVASKLNIKLAHVEAGLRSFNNNMPEEINRIITDRISDILFCPTENSLKNLQKEGFGNFEGKKIIKTGDIMLDASIFYAERGIKKNKQLGEEFILCTFHRAENTDNDKNLLTILKAINEIGKQIKIIFPIHPRTKSKIEAINNNYKLKYSNVDFCEPLGYIDMISHIKNCNYVITDSGGLQKEAFFMKKMCLTLRDQTEWVELVEGGYNYLCEIDSDKILEANSKILTISKSFEENFYGNGNTGNQIINELKKTLK